MRKSTNLSGTWHFAYSETPPAALPATRADAVTLGLEFLPCTVPGNFETDLMALGRLEDPLTGMNITKLRPLERMHLWYVREFEAADTPGFLSRLVFDGVDCYAEYFLNGQAIGSSDNMLVEHVFDVTGRFNGRNELLIHIRPTVIEAAKYDYPANLLAFAANYDSLYVRKAPHMFGWDIMPRAVSAGIWRPVRVEHVPNEGLEEARLIHTSASAETAAMSLFVKTRLNDPVADGYMVEIEGHCGDSRFHARAMLRLNVGHCEFSIANPKRWWPRGYGDPALYDVTVRLLHNGVALDERRFKYGIRTVELLRTDLTNDAGEGEFCFKINGERIFCKGTNWTPLDPFHSRDMEKLPRVLEMVEDLGCNIMRCWGGGVYEPDAFYEWCDSHGVMIWQDFAMACALYPQDDEFAGRLRNEVRKVVKRLRHHPCVVLWAGDNECDAMHVWMARGNPNDNVLTRKVIPGVLNEEDSTRPYLPSSQYISEAVYKAGMAYVTEDHFWGPRGYYKGDYYMGVKCHFGSEIGYHGCPDVESLRKFISPDKLWPYGNDEWQLHITDPVPGLNVFGYLVELMRTQHQAVFGRFPETLEQFVLADQVKQAEAFKFFIERFRAQKWRRTGIIWWNLWDGCPELSNAIVDYYWQKKQAYEVIKRSQQDPCIILCEPENGQQRVVIANDTNRIFNLKFEISDVETGELVLSGAAQAPANATTPAGDIPWAGKNPRFYLLKWESEAGRGINHHMSGNPPFDAAQYRRWYDRLLAEEAR